MTSISDLINDLNKEFKVANVGTTSPILLEITKWIARLLSTFGFPTSTAPGRLGWSEDLDRYLPEIKSAVRYRDSLRAKAIAKSPISDINHLTASFSSLLAPRINSFKSSVEELIQRNAPVSDVLAECDRFRDETMLELGISVDDTDFGIATIRFGDPKRLIQEREKKRAAESALAASRAAEKARRKEEEDRRVREKLEKGKVSPAEMFRSCEYSQWDEEVITWGVGADGRVFPPMMRVGQRLRRRRGRNWLRIGMCRKSCMSRT
jgi:cysteinyl-tRNA synthetase